MLHAVLKGASTNYNNLMPKLIHILIRYSLGYSLLFHVPLVIPHTEDKPKREVFIIVENIVRNIVKEKCGTEEMAF